MKQAAFLITFLFFIVGAFAQSKVIYEDFPSSSLEETRKLKIQLPRNYDKNLDKIYPVIVVLDANYLFEPVAGNVDYFGYWEDMPESIVVGIMQGEDRYDDCSYDETSFLPSEKGADFFEFIGLELMPYIDSVYRTAKFAIAIGHDFTANFINYYLFKDPTLFNGYINLSPDLAPKMEERLPVRIPNIKDKVFYYLATGTDDIKKIREASKSLSESLTPLKSESFNFYFDNFEGATHYSLAARAIPSAMEKIFSVYRPISKQEFSEVLMKTEMPLHEYLSSKYEVIKNLFGLANPIRENDFMAILTAAEKRRQLESLKIVAVMAQKQYPNTMLGDYFLARYYEEDGEPKKAIRTYQAAFDKEEVDFITTDFMLDKADKIKEDFGY